MAINLAKVLYPTDFSELSRYALRYAREFAEAFRAELHCIHVVEGVWQYEAGILGEGGAILPVGGDMMDLAVGQMRQFTEVYLSGLLVPPVTKVLAGNPFVEIVRYARDIKADLIVLGTHGRSGITHVLLGGTSEKVVRKAPCPVLTIRNPEHEFVMP